jgi:BA14K-like protein
VRENQRRSPDTGRWPDRPRSRSSGADELARLKESIAGATKELRQSLQQEHDRAEALATELAQTRQALTEKKTEALEDPHVVSQPTAVAAENEAAIKPLQSAPPKRRSMTQDAGSGCQHYRTYNPASSTYRGYDGQVHSCP